MPDAVNRSMKLAILVSHPVQYYAPIFRRLAQAVNIHVFYSKRLEDINQQAWGYGKNFEWDVDLYSGYSYSYLENIATAEQGFYSCDTPGIARELQAGNFTHVLSIGWHRKSLCQGIVAAKRLGLAVMVRGDSQLSTQRSWLKRAVKLLVYPILLRLFNAVLYVGQNNRRYYEHYGYPDARLFFSPHCVDNDFFTARANRQAGSAVRQQYAISEAAFVVLFVGRLVPFKNPSHVIEAAAVLRSKDIDCHVLVAGSGALEVELTDLATELEVPLARCGFVNQSELPAIYAAADVVMLPSTAAETWGLVCNEALASGKPLVIADTVGCAMDLASNAEVGRIFPLGDVAAAAAQLESIASAPPAQAAVAKLAGRYSIDAAVDGIVAAAEST